MTMWPCCYLYDQSKKSYNDVVMSDDKDFNDLQIKYINLSNNSEYYLNSSNFKLSKNNLKIFKIK